MSRYLAALFLFSLLIPALSFATPRKTASDLIGDMAWGLAQTDGYGPYRWGDSPGGVTGVNCVDRKDKDGITLHTTCEGTMDLSPIGNMTVSKATWHFEYSVFSGYTLNLEMDESAWTAMPSRVEISHGYISTVFLKGEKGEGTLMVGNNDRQRFSAILEDSLQGIDPADKEATVEFLSRLGASCRDCETVLVDYFTATGIMDHVTPTIAQSALMNSNVVAYLLALRSLSAPDNAMSVYYQALDGLQTTMSATHDALSRDGMKGKMQAAMGRMREMLREKATQ